MFDLRKTYLYRFLIAFSDFEEYKRTLPHAQRSFTPLITLLMVFPPTKRLPLVFLMTALALILYGTYTAIFTKTCIVIFEDFVTWSEVIHHTAIVYLAIFINVVILFKKSDLMALNVGLMDGIFAYKEGFVEPAYKKLVEENNNQQRRMFIVPVLIIVVTGTAIVLKPVIDYSTGVSPHHVLLENNITLSSPIPLKYPHKAEDPWEILVLGCLVCIFASIVVSTIIGADILFIRMASRIALELSLLNQSIIFIEERAKRLYARKYGLKPLSANLHELPLYQDCIEECLKENVEHHLAIKRLYDNFSAVASPAIGGGFFTCSIVMGLGMIIINMDNVNLGDMIAFAGTCIAELLNAFMISWNSELIGELNYELYNAVYGVEWYNWNKKNKKIIITFLDGTREPLFLNAFGLTKINMETFGSVVNTAYSFLNLVKASESLEGGK